MHSGPYAFLLASVRWDVFVTLTYKQAPTAERTVERHILGWLESVRMKLRLPQTDYYYFYRVEGGERTGRLHGHVLLRVPRRNRGLFIVPKPGVPWCAPAWGRGYVTTRSIEGKDDPATVYVEKDTSGANEYETIKTARATTSQPSPALLKRATLQQSALGSLSGDGEIRVTHVCQESAVALAPVS